MRVILKEPLLHFLALGVLLFALFDLLATEPVDERNQIVVQESDLLLFVRHRFGKFGEGEAEAYLAGLTPDAWHGLIDDFVKEEALFREAERLGLDRLDYPMRQRLVTRMLSIQRQSIMDTAAPTEDELEAFYTAHRNDYRIPAYITFSALRYLGDGVPGAEAVKSATRAGAPSTGGEWETRRTYRRQMREDVQSQFGADASKRLFDSSAEIGAWVGPIATTRGELLVRLEQATPGSDPDFPEIRPRLIDDFRSERMRLALKRLEEDLRSEYEVRLEPQLKSRLGSSE